MYMWVHVVNSARPASLLSRNLHANNRCGLSHYRIDCTHQKLIITMLLLLLLLHDVAILRATLQCDNRTGEKGRSIVFHSEKRIAKIL